jgi:hypothetical protein
MLINYSNRRAKMIDCSVYSRCRPENLSKLGFGKKIRRGHKTIV